MPLSFDDLVPQQNTAPVPAAPSGGLSFDDLVPQKATPEVAPATSGTAPVPTTLETFFKNLGPYVAGFPGRFADLAKGAVTGEILPQSANMPGGERQGDILAVLSAAALGTPLSVAGGTPKVLAPFKAPTEAALEASKTARYSSPAIADLRIDPNGANAFANVVKKRMLGEKLDPQNAPTVMSALDRFQSGARFEGPTTQTQTLLSGPGYHIADDVSKPAPYQISDFDLLRQSISDVPYPERRAASIVRGAIDKYLGNIPTSHVLSGDVAAANDALLKARADTAALKRSEDVSSALGRAENQAGSTYSGKGFENASRQQLRPILNEKQGVSKRPGFEDYTPEELEAARQAVNGTWLGNFVRTTEKKLGGGGGLGSSHAGVLGFLGASHLGFSPEESAAIGYGISKVGQGFGALANRMAASRGNYLGDLLRSRSPLADEMRANPQMVPAFWPQLLRIPPSGLGSPSVPTLGINAQQL